MDTLLSSRDIDNLVTFGGKFLRTASTKSEIMELLVGLGYSDVEHRTGWDLYLKMLGYMGAGSKPAAPAPGSTGQLAALNEIDHYDEPTFRRATAALQRLHPEQYQYFFGDGLTAKTGPEAVGTVQLFLDRYAALRDGTDAARADKRAADQAAVATLEARNIVTPAIEQHLRELIEAVKRAAPLRPAAVVSISEESLQAAARAFKDWLNDWRTTASAGVMRRDYRIMLGISRRRSPESADDSTPPANAVPASTATTQNPPTPASPAKTAA